jgi:putative DNA primase/helicase
MSLHQTWVTSTGKAEIERPRLLLRGHRKAGGVIRLWPDEAVTYGLAVSEGVETGLAAAHAYTPVWACVDAGNLASLPLLPAIDALTIFADHDKVGLTAAATLARRWSVAMREVLIATPEQDGYDIADVVTA